LQHAGQSKTGTGPNIMVLQYAAQGTNVWKYLEEKLGIHVHNNFKVGMLSQPCNTMINLWWK